MKIFRTLFGQRKLSAPSATSSSTAQSYLVAILNDVRVCTTIPHLASYLRDYSGYVREAALARCIELGALELLPAIAERLNDWVPQVRQAARSALMTLLPFVPTAQLLALLPVVFRLINASRADHTAWIAQFELAFIRQVDVGDLTNAVHGRDVKVARACFQLLKRQKLLDAAALAALALKSQEDIVLAIEAIKLCEALPVESRDAQYAIAAKSHFGAVRTLALRALLSSEADSGKDRMAVDALLDVQSSVRAVAMAYLRTRHFDLNGFYRNILREPGLSSKRAQVALVSLANLRATEDLPLIKEFTAATHPSVRKAAYCAWMKIAEGDKDAVALAALKDDAASIRKFALQAVRRLGAYIPFSLVRSILEERGDQVLLLSFAERSKWQWLECLVRLSLKTASGDVLWPRLVEGLREWAARSGSLYDEPTAEQVDFFRSREAAIALESLAGIGSSMQQVLALELSQINVTSAPARYQRRPT